MCLKIYATECKGEAVSNKTFYIIMLVISVIISAMTIVVSVTKTAGTDESIFNSPFVVILFGVYVAVQIVCIFKIRGKLTMYRIGFYILQCGLVLTLVGMYIYYLNGDKLENVAVPVDGTTYSTIQRDADDDKNDLDEKYVDLGFALGFSDFKVEKYEDGSDKFYDAKLIIVKRGVENPESKSLRVNHPVRAEGWKIYLMNYEEADTGKIVYILLKYNPGEYITLLGIWMTIIGGFIMCLLRKRGAE